MTSVKTVLSISHYVLRLRLSIVIMHQRGVSMAKEFDVKILSLASTVLAH
jgi:hypothetical protein